MVRYHSGKTVENELGSGRYIGDLVRTVKILAELDLADLRREWTRHFGTAPSRRILRSLLVQAIAYRLQEDATGRIKPATRRILGRVVAGDAEAASKTNRPPTAGAGSVLIREWQGVRHRVTVLDHDVVYGGRRFKSLSEVARAITGTHWSGPRFFGLKRRSKEVADG